MLPNQQAPTNNLPPLDIDNGEIAEVAALLQEIDVTAMPDDLKQRAEGMVKRLSKMLKYGAFTKEFEPVEKYVSWIIKIPWEKYTQDNLDLNTVKAQLDKTHYGLVDVKEKLLEYIAMLNLLRRKQQGVSSNSQTVATAGQAVTPTTPVMPPTANEMSRLQGSSSHAPILCLVGVQGIGKTSIAKSIATAMNRNFVRISLGGLGNVTELRGVPKSADDAEPGQIIKSLIRTEVMNPLILMDEIDKVSGETGLRADVMAALLEILDPEQNSTFIDHYLDYPIDLSKVMFVCTANNLGGISAALLDRLEIVRMSSYSDDEKLHIAKEYLLPKVMETSGLDPDQIIFSDQVWPLVIRPLGFDAGIRQLERNITTLVRKVAKKVVTGEGKSFEITPENFREYIPMDMGVLS